MTNSYQTGRIWYGADYNPEQWDAQTVGEDIELMRQARVNLVSLGIFSWSRLEPVEGQYDFEWLRDIIDQLYAADIQVDLATATASPPVWMATDHPDMLPMNAQGVRLGFGSRQHYCPNSLYFRKKSAALAGELARQFKDHPAVVLWHISNEYGCHTWECFCPQCRGAFQVWLRHRYGDIDSLNRAWGTDFWAQRYADFRQISTPAAMPTFANPSQLLDWRRFCSQSLLGCYQAEAQALREAGVNQPITTNFMGLFSKTDYWRFATEVDVVADDSYPDPVRRAGAAQIALEADLMRSLRRGPFILMEQTPSAVQWRTVNSAKRPGQNQLWSLQRLAQGADAIMYFQWRQSRAGAETFHSGMVPHAGADSRIFREMVDLGKTLEKLGQVVGQNVSTRVGLLWDWESEWARQNAIGPRETPFGQALVQWHRTLFEAGHCVDFLPLNGVDAAGNKVDFADYSVIVIPQVFAMESSTAELLQVAVQAGTQLIIAAPSAVVDENLHAHLGSSAGPLSDLAGVRVVEPWPSSHGPESLWADYIYPEPNPAVDRITSAVGVPSSAPTVPLQAEAPELVRALEQIGTPTPGLIGQTWAELLEVTDPEAKIMASYLPAGAGTDIAGHPALVMRKLGEGAVYYLSTDLDSIGRAALFKVAAARARLYPPHPNLPAGVQVVERGKLRFLLNHSDAAVELSGIVGQELLSGKPAAGHLVLAPRSAAVIA